VPAAAGPQVPFAPQAWHKPSHAVLQHTPSMQKPVSHSLAMLQPPPIGFFGVHAPPMQKLPGAHSALVLQPVPQLFEPAHR
jgi:hypothetical protein